MKVNLTACFIALAAIAATPRRRKMHLISCCMAMLAALATESWAADRGYVMNGFWAGTGLAKIAARLRERGYIVGYGSYTDAAAFAADACAHPAAPAT